MPAPKHHPISAFPPVWQQLTYTRPRRREFCDAAHSCRPNARDFIEKIHLRENGPNFHLPSCLIALHEFSQFVAKLLPWTLANSVSIAPTRMAYLFRWRNRSVVRVSIDAHPSGIPGNYVAGVRSAVDAGCAVGCMPVRVFARGVQTVTISCDVTWTPCLCWYE
jgi:hypothetical protein